MTSVAKNLPEKLNKKCNPDKPKYAYLLRAMTSDIYN